MKIADKNPQISRRAYVGGGTFSANPITMAAGIATIRYLAEHRERHKVLKKKGDYMIRQINKVAEEMAVRARATGCGSLFLVHFLRQQAALTSTRSVDEWTHRPAMIDFDIGLLGHGILVCPGVCRSLSFAHDNQDIDALLDSVTAVFENMR